MKKFACLAFVFVAAFGCKKKIDEITPPPPPPTGGGTGFSSNATVPVTANTVRVCFNGMAMKDVHPRLLYTAEDIAQIKLSAQSDAFAKATYDEIIAKANAIIPTPLLDYGLDGAGLRISNLHTISNDQLPFLVLAYQFTKDTKYALRAWQQLDRMCDYTDWGANRHFLDAGIAAKGVAIAYDGLYDYLTAAQRTRLSNAVRAFVLQPGKTQIETNTGVFKWYLTDDNWNGICHGGMIMAALATYEQDSTFNSNVVSLAANGTIRYMQSLAPDGASEEGMSYWSYGMQNTILAFESMKRVLSTTYGLAEQPGFQKTGWFPYLVSGPVGTVSVGDDYTYNGKNNRMLSYFWFSKYFNNANLAKAHYEACITVNSSKTIKMNGWSDLLFYKKELVNAGSSTALPLNGYVKGLEYMFVQESANNDNALYIGMHTGNNASSHGHLDAGSFYIQALGETFAAGNLGVENPYPADYFNTTAPLYNGAPTTSATSPGRFYYYRVKTESKNCLVFNPDARPEQNPAGVATVIKDAADVTGGYYVSDLGSCYSRDVSNYKRGIKMNRNTGIITVQDEFTPTAPNSTVYWLMQSAATDGLIISTDGKTATMSKNGKTFYAIIQSPSTASFTKIDRSTIQALYLPETAPIFGSIMTGKNGINQFFGKLQIKLTGVTAATTIRVDFLKSTTAAVPPLIALSAWTTSN